MLQCPIRKVGNLRLRSGLGHVPRYHKKCPIKTSIDDGFSIAMLNNQMVIWTNTGTYNLVGGAITILKKYEFVNGKDDIPYMKWKIKNV
jgi:hypothetical protein